MKRPDFINNKDIDRWNNILKNDPDISEFYLSSEVIREVCYAGIYLCEELDKLFCPTSLIERIQEAAGKRSFGRDTWEVSLDLLEKYKNNKLILEDDKKSTIN